MHAPLLLFFVALAVFVLASLSAMAQPVHSPGTICITPRFWCWAAVPGSPGQPCTCPTAQGMVNGTLG